MSGNAWHEKWAEITGAVRKAMAEVDGVDIWRYEEGEGGFFYTVTVNGETTTEILTFT